MSQQTTSTHMRDKIAAEAAELFAESGYAAVSMRVIASKTGIKAASLYNHYPDKESLYFASLAHAFEKRIKTIEAAISDTNTESIQVRLQKTMLALGQTAIDDPVAARLLQRELLDADEPRLRKLTETLFQETFARIIALLKEAGARENPSTLALYITGLIHGYFSLAPIWRYLKLEDSIPETPEKLAEELSMIVTSNLGGD